MGYRRRARERRDDGGREQTKATILTTCNSKHSRTFPLSLPLVLPYHIEHVHFAAPRITRLFSIHKIAQGDSNFLDDPSVRTSVCAAQGLASGKLASRVASICHGKGTPGLWRITVKNRSVTLDVTYDFGKNSCLETGELRK